MKSYLFMLFTIILLFGCSNSSTNPENSEQEKMKIYQTGQENVLNGRYKGYYTYYEFGMTIKMWVYLSLQNGKIIQAKMGDPNVMWFYSYSDGGYIGYYSYDGTNFKAAGNFSAPGAPITTVTDILEGKVNNFKIQGTWTDAPNSNEPETYSITMEKYSDNIEIYYK